MTKYVVRLYGDTHIGRLECDAPSPEEAVSLALRHDTKGIDWQPTEQNDLYAAEVFDAPDADSIHEWTTEAERMRRASYYLMPFLADTVDLLPEGEPKLRLTAFLAYVKGQGTFSDILPSPSTHKEN